MMLMMMTIVLGMTSLQASSARTDFFSIVSSFFPDQRRDYWNQINDAQCPGQFNCQCRFNPTSCMNNGRCIDRSWVCDGIVDCEDASDEVDCICSPDEFQCSECLPGAGCEDPSSVPYFQCISISQIGDGISDCLAGYDEPSRNRNRECREFLYCDGRIDCDWLTPNDEANCTGCPSFSPIRCNCNAEGNFTCDDNSASGGRSTCYRSFSRCDGFADCADGSDELRCPCREDEFACDCISEGKCVPRDGCKNKASVLRDGFISCPNEPRTPFGLNGRVSIHRLHNISECNNIGFPECDNSSCYHSNILMYSECKSECNRSTYLTCNSYCSDKSYCQSRPAFQCADNSLIFLDHFCDGTIDCIDGSDEIVNQPGFKCNAGCVLPQVNLYDDLAHCSDSSDLCFSANVSCFECLDKRLLISFKQVCDGVNDCYDLSDECFCDNRFDNELCAIRFEANPLSCLENTEQQSLLKIHFISTANTTVTQLCRTKYASIQATLCDGRPECKDYSDECDCDNPPSFCNDTCRLFYPMGDRYCDGIEDPVWRFINDSSCPQGFDERLCPKRFKCNATGKVSIDVLQVCDGFSDCDDGSDELNCSVQIKDER